MSAPTLHWIVETEDLLSRLRGGLEVYRIDGTQSWTLTRTGGVRVDRKLVERLAAEGIIRSVYSNCPRDSYHLGRTLDVDRTLESRKRLGRKDIRVHVGDPA